ncbi:MAG: NAD-dependent epimerase/dehydratase family protein [Desulfuromonadales bacterium]|nr:NAD-dependent epimerase/dehydratase family protein [Desulfuromonadales bacterium]
MQVLIIGGAGFLGANLVRRCLAEPEVEVTVLDSLDPHLHATTRHLQEVWPRIRFVRGDLRDETLLADVVQGQEIIFNCAAQTSHPLSIQYPLLDAEINCLGNLKLLESLRLLNSKARIVYTSSSTVIGKAQTPVVNEDHRERPLEIYSANKGVAEKYYRIYHTIHDLQTVVLRFANLYGPYGKGFQEFGFINYFIHLARTGQEIRIFGSGMQTRNVLYVEDAVDILWRAAQEPRLVGESWFATSDQHLTVAEIAQTITRVLANGRVSHIDWPEERKRIEIDQVIFSAERLRSVLDWRPRFDFEQGLRRLLQLENQPS